MGEEITHARNRVVDPECEEVVREAADECPTNAIVIE